MKSKTTEETKKEILRFLSSNIITLEESKRIGNKHYYHQKDVNLLIEAIREMAYHLATT
jgi:hypothetical protein